MDLRRPLSVVTPTVDGDVLTALALADAWFTPARLHGVIGRHSQDGVRRALRRLVHQGVVDDQPAGNAVLYRLNRSHLAAPAVVQLANLWGIFVQRLSETIESWPVRPVVAALFGSAARGTMTVDSDVDVFLVRSTSPHDEASWFSAVARLEHDASRWTGNDVRVLQMTEAHVREHAAVEPVLRDVLADGVPLLGDLGWLHGQVGRASHPSGAV